MREPTLVGWRGILCIATVVSYIESHELSIMHDMVEGFAGPIVCGKFRHEKSPWGVVMNDMRAKRRREHVVQSFVDEANGWLVWGVSPSLSYRLVREDVLHQGVIRGSGCIPQVVATGGLVFPSPCGPNLARIASDN